MLAYPKFKLAESEIRELLTEDILPFITPARATKVPRVIPEDRSDDAVLACAVAGKADLIVSGDHHLLNLSKHQGISILSVKSFFQEIG